MKVWILMVAVMLGMPALGVSKERTIDFNIDYPGFPPYVMNKPPSGIVYDVLALIAKKHGYRVKVHTNPRSRVALLMQQGKIDATATAIEWIESPENYEFSDPVVQIRNMVYFRVSSPLVYRRVDDLFGLEVGGQTGDVYPPLSPHFKSRKINRVNSRDELGSLRLLSKGRINAAIVTEHVGQWVVKKNRLKGHYRVSDVAVDAIDYRIMFPRRLGDFVHRFNKDLRRMKHNGEMERILSRYR